MNPPGARMTETAVCPFCESEISATAKKCSHCGEWVSRNCQTCGTPIRDQWAARGFCADCGVKIEIADGAAMPCYVGVNNGELVYQHYCIDCIDDCDCDGCY